MRIEDFLLGLGARRVGFVPVREIVFDASFRALCEQNSCGQYGRNWMCPPDVGPMEELMARARRYDTALVFQTVDALEDSFDVAGMAAARDRMNRLIQAARGPLSRALAPDPLFLGAGGCRACRACARPSGRPCRDPARALSSLEAYGVAVSQLAERAGMPYVNGPGTVTYFGAALFSGAPEGREIPASLSK